VRLLHRLGNDVAGRHRDVLAFEAGERRLRHAAQRGPERLVPLRPLLAGVNAEAVELGDRRRLATAELHPAVRNQVERGDPLRHPEGVVDVGRHVHDAMAEADVLRPLAGGSQEDLRRRGVRVLLQEVVLGDPDAVQPDLVGQLDELESILEDLAFLVFSPRTGNGVLQEQRDFHTISPCLDRQENAAGTSASLAHRVSWMQDSGTK
jgi:hypothetical protein